MAVQVYADLPGRRARQVAADLGMLGWIVVWAWVGRAVYSAIVALRAPADRLRDSGTSLAGSMSNAEQQLGDVPILGDRLQGPFGAAADTAREVAVAGQDLGDAITRGALISGWTTAVVPIVVVGGLWLWWRVRFARQASAARVLLSGHADTDLFALRALTSHSVATLARIHPDPGAAWRRGDPGVVAALAALELRRLGLAPGPRPTPQ